MSVLKKVTYALSLSILVFGAFGLFGAKSSDAINPIDDFCTEVNGNTRYNNENNTVCDANDVDKFREAVGAGLLDEGGFIYRIINFISFLTGFLAVVFIIVGGLQFTFSGGDAEKAKKGRKMILYSLIGVAVTVASGTILKFAISVANG